MTVYPGTLDSFDSNTDDVDDVLAADMNNVQDAIVAIETELGTDPAGSAADLKTRLAHSMSDAGMLEFDQEALLTISSGAITVTQNLHRVDTEASAASDDLDTINGNSNGLFLIIRANHTDRTVVVKHNTGNIYCTGGQDITLDTTYEIAWGYYDGTQSKWILARGLSGTAVVTGTGSANQVAVFSGAATIGSSAALQFDGSELEIVDDNAAFHLNGSSFDWSIELNNASGYATITADTHFDDHITIAEDVKIYFDSTDTYITANTDDPEDLEIAADQDILLKADNQVVTDTVIRGATSLFRRYYHIPVQAVDPGASGATWTPPDANTIGGYQLDAAGEVLYLQTDVHSDWNGNTDLIMEVRFEVNVDNSGGNAGDTVDLKAVFYYKGTSEVVTKTQTVEVPTTVGQSAQYNQFSVSFTINYDETDNVVQAGDMIHCILNLETDTSEVDDIIINAASFYYQTTHTSIESGDV